MIDEIASSALVMLIEANWWEFVDYAGDEEAAQETLEILKADCGME